MEKSKGKLMEVIEDVEAAATATTMTNDVEEEDLYVFVLGMMMLNKGNGGEVEKYVWM